MLPRAFCIMVVIMSEPLYGIMKTLHRYVSENFAYALCSNTLTFSPFIGFLHMSNVWKA
jgi:hypothetical protein